MSSPAPIALYLHIPFCRRKCAYCDFNSFAHDPERDFHQQETYTAALVEEVRRVADVLGSERRIGTIFVGGGTPSLLDQTLLQQTLRSALALPRIADAIEVTVEANPGSLTEPLCAAILESGGNRLSIGAQSFDDSILRNLDRIHLAKDIETAVEAARRAGIDNLNLDLIFGAPGQDLAAWRRSLEFAIALKPQHLSLYGLTIEKGTPFYTMHRNGELHLPDDDDQVAMFEEAIAQTEAAGFEHYEISNYAQPGHRSVHNLLYWRNAEYVGCGAGAVSKLDNHRWRNYSKPEQYTAAIREIGTAVQTTEDLDGTAMRAESIMLGLRLREGIDLRLFAERHGQRFDDLYAARLPRLLDEGLLEMTPDRCRLTKRGLFLADSVIVELL